MMHDDFEDGLRSALATLAREAIPDDRLVPVDDVPAMQALPRPDDRRVGTRLLAAAVAVVVALGAGAIALTAHHDNQTPPVLKPAPTWTRVAAFPLLARSAQSAVFTGRAVLVWGGRSDAATAVASASPTGPPSELGDGAAYDVAADDWSVLPAAPLGARYGAVAAWTGSEMIVTGGKREGTAPNGGTEGLQDGAAYDPAHHRWRRIPDAPGCPAFGTWTGRVLVVGGYCNTPSPPLVMDAYDPARDAWTTLPSYADARQLVSVGGRVFAWTGGIPNRGAVLDRAARKWSPLPALPAPGRAYRWDSLAVAYEGHLAVAGRLQRASDDPPRDHASVDVFDLAAGSWRHYESTEVPSATDGFEIAAGGGALLWIDGLSFNWFVGPPSDRTPSWSSVIGSSPVRIGGSGESVVPIGGRRFFIWGGRLAGTEQEPTNRPTPEGAILQLP